MTSIRNANYPWSVDRLVEHCKTWNFDSDVERLEERDGEPYIARACRRVNQAMREWRDAHHPEEDPLFDDSLAPFHVNDIAALIHEYERLARLKSESSMRSDHHQSACDGIKSSISS